jgi:ATP-dependent RNA helicase DDX3X
LDKLMGKAKKLAAPRPNPAMIDFNAAQVRAEPLVVIVVPTRELAVQIFNEARKFCYRTMLRPCVAYGGGPIGEQIRQLAKGCDILIASPGRLVDFIERPHILTLRRLRYMVIDEADEMLHDDWNDEVGKILSGGGKLISLLSRLLSYTLVLTLHRTGRGQRQVYALLRHLSQTSS